MAEIKGEKKNRAFAALLVISVCVLVWLFGLLLTPRYVTVEDWLTTTTYKSFYEKEKDSIDVVILGSSRAQCSVDPKLISDETGLSAYNLSCEQQNLLITYYWLSECLRTQKPKVVLLDTGYLFDNENLPLFSEPHTRKAFDFMKWSDVKLKAILDMKRHNPDEDVPGYFIPLLRYHDRWKEIPFDLSGGEDYDGFCPLTGDLNDYRDVVKFKAYKETEESESMNAVSREYLDKVYDLCEENGIELILFTSMSAEESAKKHAANQSYADEKGIRLIDFNLKETYKKSGLSFYDDADSGNHPNVNGAEKISLYLAKELEGAL